MEHSRTPPVVVFDLAGVLLPSGGSIDDLAAEPGAGSVDLADAYGTPATTPTAAARRASSGRA